MLPTTPHRVSRGVACASHMASRRSAWTAPCAAVGAHRQWLVEVEPAVTGEPRVTASAVAFRLSQSVSQNRRALGLDRRRRGVTHRTARGRLAAVEPGRAVPPLSTRGTEAAHVHGSSPHRERGRRAATTAGSLRGISQHRVDATTVAGHKRPIALEPVGPARRTPRRPAILASPRNGTSDTSPRSPSGFPRGHRLRT